jgi:hypothetical protein
MRHNRTKCRENGTREQNYFLSIMPMQVYNTPLGSRMGTGPPLRGPPRGPAVNVFYVDGGRSRITSSGTSQGASHQRFFTLMVDTPRSSAPAPPGARRRCFLALIVGALGSSPLAPPGGPPSTFFTLMVDAPGSLAPTPPGAPLLTFLSVDGGRSRISSSGTSRGPAVDVS